MSQESESGAHASRTYVESQASTRKTSNRCCTNMQRQPLKWSQTRLKLLLVTILVCLLQNQLVAQATRQPSQPPRAHRKRDSPMVVAVPTDRAVAPPDEASPRQFTIPANQRQIIQMFPQDERNFQNSSSPRSRHFECPNGLLTFELSTGFIYKPAGSADTLSMLPSTLQLTDCLDFCLQNSSCLAINFEMGLCVLLAASAGENPQNLYSSQFPVFTIYAEKKCLLSDPVQGKPRRKCQRAWTFERVAGFEMKLRPKRRMKLAAKELCMEACLSEQEFECRSANWYRETGECQLSDQDRHSVSQSEAGDQQIKSSLGNFYGPASNGTDQLGPIAPKPAGLYQNYRHSSGAQNESPAVPRASGSEASLSSKLITSWTSGKKHFKKMLFGGGGGGARESGSGGADPSGAGRAQTQKELLSRAGHARQLDAGWSALGSSPSSSVSTFDGHYIDVPASTHVDYLENNCIYEPNKLCEFRKIQNRILKTVDSIYQDVSSLEECKQKCLNAPYRCYSFDYGDTSERVCRTSHLDQASLLSINEPYLEVVGAITYELATCFNVSVQCKAKEMLIQVSSSKSFNGKIYAKSRPSSCVTDVKESLHFELAMKYHDDEQEHELRAADNSERACDVRASSSPSQGIFSNDIVIQHHDRIMTTQDVGLSVFCHYDLGNRSVTNNIDLAIEPLDESSAVESKQSATGSHSANKSPLTITGLATTVVRSPNVTMRITNMNGQPISSATVGDRLALLFEVKEKTSPFGIFVREIVAMDGRQYLQKHHHLYHHSEKQQPHHHFQHHDHENSSPAQVSQSNVPNRHEIGDSDKSTTPSVLYYSPSSASAGHTNAMTTSTSSPLTGLINDSLVESMYQIDSVNSIQFLDSSGCPTDSNLMGPLVKMDPHGHRLLAPFDAFKFPTSDLVFFRAVVTSCLAECKPAICPNYPSTASTATTSAATTPNPLYSSTLDHFGPNSIVADETHRILAGGPTPGVAELLTLHGDN